MHQGKLSCKGSTLLGLLSYAALKKKKKKGRMWQSSMVPVLPSSCSRCLLHLAASLHVPKPSLQKGGLGAE